MPIVRMVDLDLHNQRVIIREDFNVPLKDGKITSDARIQAALPTIELALKQNAAVILLSHLGRPEEGQWTAEDSLVPVSERLSQLLHKKVPLIKDWVNGVTTTKPGEVILCENVRFEVGENKNSDTLAKKMAALGDVFVMDAFATSHRAQASTYGIAKYAKIACAGPLLTAELDALGQALALPARPMVAIVAGSKVSTKLTLLEALSNKMDALITGGGIANTFLAAAGFNVGKSLYEPDLLETSRKLLAKLQREGKQCPLPIDVVVAKTFHEDAPGTVKNIDVLAPDDMILDIGPKSIAQLEKILLTAKTIVWNGPVGVFEFPNFRAGTKAMAETIATNAAYSIAGGGDTVAAIEMFGVSQDISYISTAGGAFLEFLEGKTLPAVAILEQRGSHK
jgi:phosphoglycerate kinase